MLALSAAVFVMTVWALSFRTSVALLDRGNQHNTFGLALFLGFVFGLVASFTGLIIGLLATLGLIRILVVYYEMGVLRAIAVLLLTDGFLFLAQKLFVSFVAASPLLAQALVTALPAVVFVGWWIQTRASRRGGDEVPKARAVRAARAQTSKPAKPSKPKRSKKPKKAEKSKKPGEQAPAEEATSRPGPAAGSPPGSAGGSPSPPTAPDPTPDREPTFLR